MFAALDLNGGQNAPRQLSSASPPVGAPAGIFPRRPNLRMLKPVDPFQVDGINFLANNFHALLADEPGLGKTVQAIGAVDLLGLQNNLVVCPASVRRHWWQEVEKWTGNTRGWEIISYNGAVKESNLIELMRPGVHWDSIILDEAHFLKTYDSQRTEGIFGNDYGLARRADYKWALTGTPILNRPRELYPILKCMASHRIKGYCTFESFTEHFCGAYWDGFQINTKGATNLEELAQCLDGFMLRRTKREVFPDRVEPLVSRIPLELTRRDLSAVYEEERAIGAREMTLSSVHERFSQLGDTSRLLRLTGEAKIRAICEFIDDRIQTDGKVIVFAHHKTVIAGIKDRMEKRKRGPVIYEGNDNSKEAAKTAFIYNPWNQVIIGERQTMGTGVDGLQRASSTVIIAEPSWVPGETTQMIRRADRMGQEDDLVTAYITYAPDTLEMAVLGSHDRKERIIDPIMRPWIPKHLITGQVEGLL